MLKNTFLKELFTRRWSTLIWCAAIFGLCLFFVTLFHSISSANLVEALKNMPESMRGLIGDQASYTTIAGYINQQMFVKSMPIIGVVYAILLFSGVLAGDEGEGTLQTTLTNPISRGRLLIEKGLAAMFLSAIFVGCALLGAIVGVLIIRETVPWGGLVAGGVSLWVLMLVFGGLAYLLSAFSGKRGLSGSLAGALAFAGYLISSLAVGVTSLQTIDKFLPFRYYDGGSYNVVTQGLKWHYVQLLATVAIIFLVSAWLVFQKRDIQQR